MTDGFDFGTEDVLEAEIEAIYQAINSGTLRISKHAQNEAWLDGLSREDVLDIVALYDEVSKDMPDNSLGRAPGLNFERGLYGGVRALAKVGWNGYGFYIVVTVLVKR